MSPKSTQLTGAPEESFEEPGSDRIIHAGTSLTGSARASLVNPTSRWGIQFGNCSSTAYRVVLYCSVVHNDLADIGFQFTVEQTDLPVNSEKWQHREATLRALLEGAASSSAAIHKTPFDKMKFQNTELGSLVDQIKAKIEEYASCA
jgi:hypothetical protein